MCSTKYRLRHGVVLFSVSLVALTGVLIIILSPYFEKQLAMPFRATELYVIGNPAGAENSGGSSSKNGEISASPAARAIVNTNSNEVEKKTFYLAEDIASLNKSLRISDTISLLGILLAVFAALLPTLAYLTIKKEGTEIERRLEKQVRKLFDAKADAINAKLKNISLLLIDLDSFHTAYIADKENEVAAATDIRSRLLNIVDEACDVRAVFEHIDNYIELKDSIEEKDHVKALVNILRRLHKGEYFRSKDRMAALDDFTKNTLGIDIREIVR